MDLKEHMKETYKRFQQNDVTIRELNQIIETEVKRLNIKINQVGADVAICQSNVTNIKAI